MDDREIIQHFDGLQRMADLITQIFVSPDKGIEAKWEASGYLAQLSNEYPMGATTLMFIVGFFAANFLIKAFYPDRKA